MRNALAGLLLAVALVGAMAYAVLPSATSITLTQTPSGRFDTNHRDGNDGGAAVPLVFTPGCIPAIAFTEGTADSFDLSTCLQSPPASSPTYSVLVNGAVSGVSLVSSSLTYSGTGTGSGTYRIRATLDARTGDSESFMVTATAVAGADTTAPTQVIGLSCLPDATGFACTWLPAMDPRVASQTESGLKEYRLYLDGSGTATAVINSASVGLSARLTGTELGGSTSGSCTQTGNNYSIVSSGSGIGTTDAGMFCNTAITGDFRLCADAHGITGGNSNAAIYVMARESSDAGDLMFLERVNATDTRARGRATANAATVQYGTSSAQGPPTTLCIERSGSTLTAHNSTDGNSFTQRASTSSPVLSASVLAGILVGTGGGSATTADVRNLTLQQLSPVTYHVDIADGASHAIAVRAVDNSLNLGTLSASVIATAPGTADVTAPSAPTGLTGSGPSQDSVAWTWDACTDPSGIRGYIVDTATNSGFTTGLITHAEQAATSLTLSGVGASATRYARVRCPDNAGNTSSNSSGVSATSQSAPPADAVAPSVPTANYATGWTERVIKIFTDGSTDNVGGCGVQDYRLLRSTSVNGPFTPAATFTSSPYFYDTGGAPDTTYYFRLTARDCAGTPNESAQSATFKGFTWPGSGGSFEASDSFSTSPLDASKWATSTDSNCTRSISATQSSDSPSALRHQLGEPIVAERTTHHCEVSSSPQGSFTPGVRYILNFRTYQVAPWSIDDGATGDYNILFQVKNTTGGPNPSATLDVARGYYEWNVRGRLTATGPWTRNVRYATQCGTYATNQWVDWIIDVKFNTNAAPDDGHFRVWRDQKQCIDDVGINRYLQDSQNPFVKLGIYRGNYAWPPDELTRDIYHDHYRRGRVTNGVSLSDVVTR